MRVIAGEKGGRRLWRRRAAGPVRPATGCGRPPSRCSIAWAVLDGARVWDLFAGSGAMGIEALSARGGPRHLRGAGQSRLSATRANLAALGYGRSRATVVCADVLTWVAQTADRGLDQPAGYPAGAAEGATSGTGHGHR